MPALKTTIMTHFASLTDPRIDRTKRHLLIDILTIALCATICDCDTFEDIALFGQAKYDWFKTFLALPGGIPSHDTFNRVFAKLDPDAFRQCFQAWIQEIQVRTGGDVIALDGKTLRGSLDQAGGGAALHLVSAWSSLNGLVLGQVPVDDKSNEVTAIPKLLEILDIAGCIITLDAQGTQKAIAAQIIDQEADYILALKDNHPNLKADVAAYFERCQSESWRTAQDEKIAYTQSTTSEPGHGRIETRRVIATDCPEWVDGKALWNGLRSIVLVESERLINQERSFERRYYLTSLPAKAKVLGAAVRQHWGIENSLHWVLDTAFREDECRVRKDHAPANLATVRHMALNLLKQETSGKKKSIASKRKLAGWLNEYLLKVIAGPKN